MNPGDEALVRTVTYIGIGIALLCLGAAIFVQVWMYRKGKATAKDLSELLSTIGWMLVFGGIGAVGSVLPRHSLATSVISSLLGTGGAVWLLILAYNGMSSILAREGSVSEWARFVFVLMIAAKLVLGAAHEMPRTDWIQSIIVFSGACLGLAGAWLQDTLQEKKPKAVDSDKVIIVKAS